MSKSYSLHLGLNHVDPKHYEGWTGELNACENDAKSMKQIAEYYKFQKSDCYLNQTATRESLINTLEKFSAELEDGDLFLLTYSGHGGQLPDLNNDENDGFDETWCLYDGQFLDDELILYFSKFKEGVHIVVLSDSCHSGTMIKESNYRALNKLDYTKSKSENKLYKYMPKEVSSKTFQSNKSSYETIFEKVKDIIPEPKATIRLISGCQDNQYSSDGFYNSLFTRRLLQVWNSGRFKGNYLEFHKSIVNLMPPEQTPNHLIIGKYNKKFDKQEPFTNKSIDDTSNNTKPNDINNLSLSISKVKRDSSLGKRILYVHGVNTNEKDDQWVREWSNAIRTSGLSILHKDVIYNAYFKLDRYAPKFGTYFSALSELLDLKSKAKGIDPSIMKVDITKDMSEATIGMTAQWLTYEDLRNDLSRCLKSYIEDFEPDIICAHSMGSLISYYTFQNDPNLIKDKTLITFGSQIGNNFMLNFWNNEEYGYYDSGVLKGLPSAKKWYHLFNKHDNVFVGSLDNLIKHNRSNFLEIETEFRENPHSGGNYLGHENTLKNIWSKFSN